MAKNWNYIIEGNVIRICKKDSVHSIDTYYINKYIEYIKPDLAYDAQLLSAIKILREIRNYNMGDLCASKEKNFIDYAFPEKRYSIDTSGNIEGSETNMASAYSPIVLPIVKWNEIKAALKTFSEFPTLKAFGGILGAILAFLLGGIDLLLWIAIISGIFHALFGNLPDKVEIDTYKSQFFKRIQFFLLPFAIIAVCNMVFYTFYLTNTLISPEIITFVRGFIIGAIVVYDCTGIIKKIHNMGFPIPKGSLAFGKALGETLQGVKKTFFDSFNRYLNE